MCHHHLDNMVRPLTHQVVVDIHHPSLFVIMWLSFSRCWSTHWDMATLCVKKGKGEEGSHSPGWTVTGACIITVWTTWHIVDMPGRHHHLSSVWLVTWRGLVVVVVGICSHGWGRQTTVAEGGRCWSWCWQSVVQSLSVATLLTWPFVVWRKERVQGRDQIAHLN